MNLMNISGEPKMAITFNCAELFNISEVKKSFLLKKILYQGWVKKMFRWKVILSWEVVEKCGENKSNRNIMVRRVNVFFLKSVIGTKRRGEMNVKRGFINSSNYRMCVYIVNVWVVMFTDEGFSVYIFRVCFKRNRNSRATDRSFEEFSEGLGDDGNHR